MWKYDWYVWVIIVAIGYRAHHKDSLIFWSIICKDFPFLYGFFFPLSFQLLPYQRKYVYDLKIRWKKMAGLFCTVVSLRSLSASDDIIKAVSPRSVANPNRPIDVANNQRLNRSCIFLIICSICLKFKRMRLSRLSLFSA